MLALLTSLTVCIICSYGALVGPIIITEDGKQITRYAVSGWSGSGETDGNKIYVNYDGRLNIAINATNTFYPNMYVEYKLNDKTLSWTSDLSQVGCSCNAGIFFSSMPGYKSNGSPDPGSDGTYYCDAQSQNGEFCWEYDSMEANKYVTMVTAHQCSSSPGSHISSCDKSGCGTNAYEQNSNGMGPGNNFKINTNNPFNQSLTMNGNTIYTTLSQNDNQFSFQICKNNPNNYIQNMNTAFNYGMVMIFDYWGTSYNDMTWLDGMTGCKGDCVGTGTQAIFSNIQINTATEQDLLKYRILFDN